MATPAAILSILVDVNSGKASVALAGVQKQLVTTNTHADALEKHSGRLSKSLGSISAPAERSTRSLKELAKVALEAGGAFAAFEAAKNAIETTVELGHATERLSAITGLDTKTASTWIEAMKVRGVQTKQVGMAFITLSRNIRNAEDGSKTAKKAFDELGISQKQLGSEDTQTTLLRVADAMHKLDDPTRRAALAQQLFGRGAQALVPVLAQGRKGVEEMLATSQKLGAFLPNSTKAFEGAVDAQRNMKLAADGLRIAFATALLPTLVKVSQAVLGFVEQMRTGQGAGGQFAAIIGAAFQKVKDAVGVVVPIVTTLIGQFKAGDPAIRAMAIGIAGLVVALKAAAVAQAALNVVSEASPWVRAATLIAALVTALLVLQEKNKGVHDALENAWQRLRTIAEAVFPVIRDIAVRAFTIIVGAANALRDAFNAVFPVAKRIVLIAFDAIMVAVDLLKAQFQIAWDIIGPLVRRTIDAIKFAIDNILIPIFEKLKGPLQTLGDVFKTVFGHAKDAVKLAMDFMLGAFAAFLHVVADVAGVKLPFLGRVFGNAAKSIDDAATSVDNLKRQLDGLPAKTSTEVDVQVNFLSNLQGAIAAIGATITNVGAQVAGASAVTGVGHRFMGGLVDTPGYFAGEEAPQHPEVIVATNPAYRQQNLGYWAMAGRMLGIPGFATGGLANAGAMVGATDPWAGKTAGSWMKGKAAAWVEPLKQQLIQRASFGGGSVGNLANLWVQGGGPANVAQIMGAIAMAESGGKNIIQQGQPYSTTGWGLWQITPGNSEPQFGVDQALLIPINNARAAVAKYDSQGLGAWTTYTSGAYKQFLGAPAISGGGGGGGAVGGLSPQVLAAIAFARRNGWAGSVISGFRTRAEQAALYARYLAGGHIAAPPGTSSHEFGNAVDVTDVTGFAHAMALAPAGARLLSGASYGDPSHFSITGHRKGGIHGKIPGFAKGGSYEPKLQKKFASTTALLQRMWGLAAPFYHQAGAKMPKITYTQGTDGLFVGVDATRGIRPGHRGLFIPDWVVQGKRGLENADPDMLQLLLHEWTHEFQRNDIIDKIQNRVDPQAKKIIVAEGAAQSLALGIAPGILRAMGVKKRPLYYDSTDPYTPYARWVDKNLGKNWIANTQFGYGGLVSQGFRKGGIHGKIRGFAGGGINWGKFLPKGIHADPRFNKLNLKPIPLKTGIPDINSSIGQINKIIDPNTGRIAALQDLISFGGQGYDQTDSEYATAHPGLDIGTGIIASSTNAAGQTIPAAVDQTFVTMRIAQLSQLVTWQANVKTALEDALAMIRQAIARIKAEIAKRQREIEAIRSKISDNLRKIAGLRSTLLNTHDKATRKHLTDTIGALQDQNKQLGGDPNRIGTGGKLAGWVGQVTSLKGMLDTLGTSELGIVGPSGIGGSLGTARLGLQGASDALAVFSPGSVAAALAAATPAAAVVAAAPTADPTLALRLAVSEAQFASIKDLLPFGGSFASGGIVPGPLGMPSVIIAHGGETVTPAGPAVHVHIAPGMDWLRQFISVEVDSNTRGQARNASRSLPGSR